ncbi:MAG: DNA-nicking Smr family endonuclease [Gammaproteobacteria bacterium]|jgi:DNA-nicking Smr family endonuclease
MTAQPPNKSDLDLFHEAMSGVEPIDQDKHVEKLIKPPIFRKEQSVDLISDDFITSKFSSTMPIEAATEGNRGISNTDLRKLRRGQIEPRHRLDLHGYRRIQASERLRKQIVSSIADGIRCLVIIHGKGHHAESGISVVKNEVHQILSQHGSIIAWCPASQKDGGSGATYAYLRKEKSKVR